MLGTNYDAALLVCDLPSISIVPWKSVEASPSSVEASSLVAATVVVADSPDVEDVMMSGGSHCDEPA